MQNWQHIALESTTNPLQPASPYYSTQIYIAVHGEEGIISWTVSIHSGYKLSKEDRDDVSQRNGAVSSIGSDENSPVANVN